MPGAKVERMPCRLFTHPPCLLGGLLLGCEGDIIVYMDTTQTAIVSPVETAPITELPTQPSELPGIGTLFGRTWSFIGNNFGRLLFVSVIGLLVNIPGVVASFYLGSMAQTEKELVPLLIVASLSTVLSLIGTVISMVLVSATTVAGTTMSIKELIRYALRLWWPLTLTVFFAYAVMFAGFVFLLIPGVILSVLLIPTVWVMVVEGLTGRAALERSIALVSGRWWTVWWKVTVAILFLVIALLLGVLALALVAPLFFMVGMANMVVAAIVGGVLIVLYVTVVSTATFFMMRYTYELYLGLAATASPETKSWWQGLPLSIFIPLGMLFTIIYLIAMPYLSVLDVQKAVESDVMFDAEDVDFDAWLEANPEFRNQFDNPLPVEGI